MDTLDAWLMRRKAELECGLSEEARNVGLLEEGAVITVKFEVYDPSADIPRIEPPMPGSNALYIPVRPAILSPAERDMLLERTRSPRVREALTSLLVDNKNHPTHAGASNIRDNVNSFLQYIAHRHFRLLVSKSGQWQLWEMRYS